MYNVLSGSTRDSGSANLKLNLIKLYHIRFCSILTNVEEPIDLIPGASFNGLALMRVIMSSLNSIQSSLKQVKNDVKLIASVLPYFFKHGTKIQEVILKTTLRAESSIVPTIL
ncbi:unnamed protein product [Acanthoscelides obtectus]|uniref:Uncharacterized protein n=1 Tax=Acanthoscelides obtectus TaxID=200917 RepID=A0A9P0Q6I3_ACAOB|nr:unnamed protein product [Acanthoscelides obtectus]CAK1684787.1 hypothetical protein AOBTE_LOCUS35120 [Acanthoscelides obtectus]